MHKLIRGEERDAEVVLEGTRLWKDGPPPVYPPSKVDVDSLRTAEAILGAHPELTYVPAMGRCVRAAGGRQVVSRWLEVVADVAATSARPPTHRCRC